MRYAYHFEFCERPELPDWIRGDVFSTLAFVQMSFGLKDVLRGSVPVRVRELAARRLVELGSGDGSGLALVAGALAGTKAKLVASDKYPQSARWRETLHGFANVHFLDEPLGFEELERIFIEGAEQECGRTGSTALLLSCAFHHMSKNAARAFLERAAACRAHVIVVEPLSRGLAGLMLGGASGLAALIYPLFVRVERRGMSSFFLWLRLVLATWIIPVIPFVLSHDGVVSALRQRTRQEWLDLIHDLPFDFEIDERLGFFKNFSVVRLKALGGWCASDGAKVPGDLSSAKQCQNAH